MALGTNQQTITTGANFIPELWMNEVRAFLRASLVLANQCKLFPMEGRKGDILHVPDVTEFTTTAKAANTQVTLQAPTEGQFTLTIDQHRESSFLIEDMLAVQNSYDLRSAYTSNAGYAVSRNIDSALASLAANGAITGNSFTNRVNGADVAFTGGNPADITEAVIRNRNEGLDTANVPPERCLYIHPSQKNALLAISRFTEYNMVGPGSNPLRMGQFGTIFGIDVYVSTNVATTGSGSQCNMLFNRNAISLAVQNAPRVQAQYKLEYIGWLFVVDVIYGYAMFRTNHGASIITPP